MHVPDGFVRGDLSLGAFVLCALTGFFGFRRAAARLGEKEIPLLGVAAAFVFVAQMINFPIIGGTSGHFLGAFFVALLFGPLTGCLIIFLVLLVQCFLFADGGVTALGVNGVNMGVVGSIVGYGIFYSLARLNSRSETWFLAAAGLSAWLSVVLASGVCALEIALSGTSSLRILLPAMVGLHSLVGVGEALITVGAVSLIMRVRPEIMGQKAYAR